MPKVMLNKTKTIQSPRGHEIAAWEYAIDEHKPWMFILGVFHGDELEGEYLINRLMDDLPQVTAYNLLLVPCLNPDGKELGTRENAHGVDLNRNYPTANFATVSVNPHSGHAAAGTPASEIETQLMMELVEHYHPVQIFSIHSDLHLVDYDGPAREWAVQIAQMTGYKLVENIGYPCTGSFGTWAGIEQKIPLITLETWKAKTEADLAQIADETLPALLASICGKI